MPKSISSKKKWEIIFLHQNQEGPKHSIAKTSKLLRISTWTVRHWVKVFRETGDVLEKKSPGRPRKTSKQEDEEIVEMVKNNKELSTKDVSLELKSRGINLCKTTISSRLNEAGLKYASLTSKPLLTKTQIFQRLRFARENKNRNWNNVLFTDETSVSLGPRNKKIWKSRGERMYQRKAKHYPKIHVWGCFSNYGFGRIVLFKENLTARKLIDIYQEGLLPSSKVIDDPDWILLEDNDPKHTAKLAETWREKHNIDRITWPSNSPDLNPIENVWNIVKNKVAHLQPSTLKDLQEAIKQVWSELPRNLAQNLVLSMPNRIKEITQSKGDSINY